MPGWVQVIGFIVSLMMVAVVGITANSFCRHRKDVSELCGCTVLVAVTFTLFVVLCVMPAMFPVIKLPIELGISLLAMDGIICFVALVVRIMLTANPFNGTDSDSSSNRPP